MRSPPRLKVSAGVRWGDLLPTLGALLDVAGTALTFTLAYELMRHAPVGPRAAHWPHHYDIALVISSMLVPFLFTGFGIYRLAPGANIPHEIIRVQTAWTSLMLALVTFAVLTKSNPLFSRAWFAAWFVLGSLWMGWSRLLLHRLLVRLRRRGIDIHHVLLIGDEAPMLRVLRTLDAHPGVGFRAAGYLAAMPSPRLTELGVPYLGPASALQSGNLLAKTRCEEVWIAYAWPAYAEIRSALDALSDATVAIRLVPDTFSLQLRHAVPSRVAGMALLDVNRSPISELNRQIKRIEDVVLGAVALLALAPVMLAIAIGIKLSSAGPVLFSQRRQGEHGRPFRLYKFRTMRTHQEHAGRVTQARREDDRVFPLGRLLRRTSLDELPQLWNVLLGEMSLVGPRPHATEHNELYRALINRYMWRHAVKPGITGWAQINGLRGETETVEKMEQRLEYDLYYIQNWTLWLDLEILLLTLIRGWVNPNAY